MKILMNVAIGGCVALAAATGIDAFQKGIPAAGLSISPEDTALASELIRDGELHEAAKLVGRVLDRVPVARVGVASFEELAERSTDIFVATVGRGFSHLVSGARHVTTEYDLSIEDVLKGERLAGGFGSLSLIGGRVLLEGGAWIETRPEGFQSLENGQRVLLFAVSTKNPIDARVRERAKPYPVISPSTYVGGILVISPDGLIAPRMEYARDPLIRSLIGKKVGDVVRQVREAVKNLAG